MRPRTEAADLSDPAPIFTSPRYLQIAHLQPCHLRPPTSREGRKTASSRGHRYLEAYGGAHGGQQSTAQRRSPLRLALRESTTAGEGTRNQSSVPSAVAGVMNSRGFALRPEKTVRPQGLWRLRGEHASRAVDRVTRLTTSRARAQTLSARNVITLLQKRHANKAIVRNTAKEKHSWTVAYSESWMRARKLHTAF